MKFNFKKKIKFKFTLFINTNRRIEYINRSVILNSYFINIENKNLLKKYIWFFY